MRFVKPNSEWFFSSFLVPAIFVSCIVFSHLFGTWLNIVALAIFVIYSFCVGTFKSYVLLFAAFPFANVFKLTASSLSFLTLCELFLMLKIFFDRLRTTHKINLRFFGGLVLYLGYITLISLNDFQITSILKNIAHIVILYFIIQINHKNPDFDLIVKRCSIMLSISMILMMSLSLSNTYMRLVNDYLRIVRYGYGTEYLRNCGLFTDPNYCSLAIVMTLSFSSVLFYYKQIGSEFWFLSVPLIVFGLTTYSRTFLLSICVFLLIFIFLVLFPRHHFWGVIVPILLLIIGYLAWSGHFEIINRTLVRLSGQSDITNGRMSLNSTYIQYIIDNPLVLLFGSGLNETRLSIGNNVHNLYIETVFRIGLVGTALFVYCLYNCLYIKENVKKPFATKIPVIMLLFLYFTLAGFSSFELVYYLMICGLVANISKDCALSNKTYVSA